MDETEWNEYRERHIQHLNEHGIEDTHDYIKQFSSVDLENSSERWDETQKAIDEMASGGCERLRGFCRVYPQNNQDVMFINSNPKLTVDEDFREKDNYLLSFTDRFRFREAISVAGGVEWLGRDHYFWNWMEVLEAFQEISTPWTQRDPSQTAKEWILEDRLQSVYYTNWYKFATEEEDYYKGGNTDVPNDWNYDKELATQALNKEIKAVDPDIIVAFGRELWNSMFKDNVEAQSLGEGYSATGHEDALYKVHGFPFESTEYSAKVLPLYHPTGWPGRVYSDFTRESRNIDEEDQERQKIAKKIAAQ